METMGPKWRKLGSEPRHVHQHMRLQRDEPSLWAGEVTLPLRQCVQGLKPTEMDEEMVQGTSRSASNAGGNDVMGFLL